MTQQAEFIAGEIQRLPVIGDRLRAFIHLPDIGRRPALPFTAAAHRLDARNQFAAAERLAAVIIRAQFEADDAIHLLIARGEKNQRRCPVAAVLAAVVMVIVLLGEETKGRTLEEISAD